MSSRRQTLLARVNWYHQSSLNTLLNESQVINFIIEMVVSDRFHCIIVTPIYHDTENITSYFITDIVSASIQRLISKQTSFVVHIFLILAGANYVALQGTLQMISWYFGQLYISCYNLLLNIYIRGLRPIAKQPEV